MPAYELLMPASELLKPVPEMRTVDLLSHPGLTPWLRGLQGDVRRRWTVSTRD
jgi:hypothetical protein